MSSHHITSHVIIFHPTPCLTEVKGELTDAPQYRPALSIKESEKLLESLDDMTDAEVAAVLSKLKAAVSERIKSKSSSLSLPCLILPSLLLHFFCSSFLQVNVIFYVIFTFPTYHSILIALHIFLINQSFTMLCLLLKQHSLVAIHTI